MKFIAVFLILAILTLFAGCSQGGNETVQSSAENTTAPIRQTENDSNSTADENAPAETASETEAAATDPPETSAPEALPSVTEARGSVPDGYREDGESGIKIIGRNGHYIKIETDCDNGKTLVIMKESYGNALVPFLTECYQTIYVCDIRAFELNLTDFCRNVGADDLLFATCTYTPAGEGVVYVEKVIG